MSRVERLTVADQAAFEAACHLAFHEVAHPDTVEMDQRVTDPERTFAVREDGQIVATGANLARELTVPGGTVRVAGTSAIGVVPGHTRRGHLTAMMRRLLDDAAEAGEPVAALWASEGVIYGRYGYGVAARQVGMTADRDQVRLRPGTPAGSGRVVLASPEQARPHEMAVYEQVRRDAVGFLARSDEWWDRILRDPEHIRGDATARRHALYTEQDGSVSGFVTYRFKEEWTRARNDSEVRVIDVFAVTPQAYGALWAYVAGLDLYPRLRKDRAPLDDPIQHMLADARAFRPEVYDSLWVRLADVGRALADRAYATPVDVVLEVADDFCPWNAGRWRLSGDETGATCAPSTDPADLVLTAAELGAVHLGGPTLVGLAAAGRVEERTAGALRAVSRAFAGDRQPWCPEVF